MPTETHNAIWEHTALFATRHGIDIRAFTPAKAGIRLSDPVGMQGITSELHVPSLNQDCLIYTVIRYCVSNH